MQKQATSAIAHQLVYGISPSAFIYTCEMLRGHSADIYLQVYMSALYPPSVFTSVNPCQKCRYPVHKARPVVLPLEGAHLPSPAGQVDAAARNAVPLHSLDRVIFYSVEYLFPSSI